MGFSTSSTTGIPAISNAEVSNGFSNSNISSLAEKIKKHAETLSEFAAKEGINPSLNANGDALKIPNTEKYVLEARSDLLFALKELQSLVKGPMGIVMDIGAHEILCLQAIVRFKVAQALRADEVLPFAELSQRCGLNTKDLQRILRYAMTSFIFCEPQPGFVAHTAVSLQLAQGDSVFRDYFANMCEMRFPASARTVDALEMYGESRQPHHSGFSLSRGVERGLYEEIARDEEEARRWNGAMSALAKQVDVDWIVGSVTKALAGTQNQQRQEKPPVIVDVGGGRGDVSIALADRLSEPTFIVQDALPTALTQGRKDAFHLPDGRVTFRPYDFRLQSQPVNNASVYIFKNIFHNWPDAICVEILRNQIPALKPGAVILIIDWTLHEPGTLAWAEERRRRWMDVTMLVYFGSRERSLGDWKELLREADERFVFEGIEEAVNQHDSILKVRWTG